MALTLHPPLQLRPPPWSPRPTSAVRSSHRAVLAPAVAAPVPTWVRCGRGGRTRTTRLSRGGRRSGRSTPDASRPKSYILGMFSYPSRCERASHLQPLPSIPAAKSHASTYVLGCWNNWLHRSDVYSSGIVLLELLKGMKTVDNDCNLHQLIMSRADDNAVMEAVDSEVSVTCTDMGLV
ncbi:hypothetical protein VPH35_054375 [Triticum aestivum]|uniref:Uncharacterized protein n=1 Tax=Triticum aestivum TaxID=4565 RepID=A0A077S672_WHEAT|nr:unnamed protein product [Triticum aestivum]